MNEKKIILNVEKDRRNISDKFNFNWFRGLWEKFDIYKSNKHRRQQRMQSDNDNSYWPMT